MKFDESQAAMQTFRTAGNESKADRKSVLQTLQPLSHAAELAGSSESPAKSQGYRLAS